MAVLYESIGGNDQRPIPTRGYSACPSEFARDTMQANELAREQAQLGRLAVWCDIEPSGLVVGAAVFLSSELQALADMRGVEVSHLQSGKTTETSVDTLLEHPTFSVSQRDLWALRAAIEKADALEQQSSAQ